MKLILSYFFAIILVLTSIVQAPPLYANSNNSGDNSGQETEDSDSTKPPGNLFLAEEIAKLLSENPETNVIVVNENMVPVLKIENSEKKTSDRKIRFEAVYDGVNNEIDFKDFEMKISALLRGNIASSENADEITNMIALSIDTQTHNEDKVTNYSSDIPSVVWIRPELKDLIYKELRGSMVSADMIFKALARNDGAVLLNSKGKLSDQTLNLLALAIMYDKIRTVEITAKSENKKNLYGRVAELLRQRIRAGFEGLSKLSADSGYNTYFDTGLTSWVYKRRLAAVRLSKYFWLSLMAPREVVRKTIFENRNIRVQKSKESLGRKVVGYIKSFKTHNEEAEVKDIYDQALKEGITEADLQKLEILSELMKPFEEKVAKTKLSKRLGRVVLSGLVGMMGGAILNRPLSESLSEYSFGESFLEFTESFGDWLSLTFQWVTGYYPDLTMTTMAIDMGVGSMMAYLMYQGLAKMSKHVSTRDFFTDQSRNRKALLGSILKEYKVVRTKYSSCANQLTQKSSD